MTSLVLARCASGPSMPETQLTMRTSEVETADAVSDVELVSATIAGDRNAFEVLVRRYARAAYSVALAATGIPADAEDAVQDAFVQAFEHLRDCRAPDRFASWLLRIVRNRAHNIRRREVLREGVAAPGDEYAVLHSSEMLVSSGEQSERVELRRDLLAALAQESEVRRQVLVLHDLEDWTHREIGRTLGISELMSRYHLSKVRRSMRKRLTRHRQHPEED